MLIAVSVAQDKLVAAIHVALSPDGITHYVMHVNM